MAEPATDHHLDLLALCSLTAGKDRCDWGVIARQAHRERSLDGLLTGEMLEGTERAHKTGWIASTATDDQWEAAYARAKIELEVAENRGARITTVLDDDYPLNLQFIHSLPPFIFYMGSLDEDADARSVAVVGTRDASEEGLETAWEISNELASQGITVTSGLARGIDTSAHNAALDAGGRTISVFGTGIDKVSPVGNRELAERIVDEGGLLVSQFLPTLPGAKWTFSKRNEVTSGISQATIVIEASIKSGARKQARLAYEHGKRVFLIQSLVESEEWANSMVEQGRATPMATVEEVASSLADPDDLRSADKTLHKESLALLTMTTPSMTIPQGRHNFPECPTCPYLLHDSWDICTPCVSERHPPVANPCPICSQENSAVSCQNSLCQNTAQRCFDNIYAITTYDAYDEGELEKKIKRYKYGNGVHCDTVWSIIFSRMLIGYLEQCRTPSAVDIIIPNPSNPGRNHIEIIFRRAAELSSGTRWNFDPVDDPAVVKTDETHRAVGENRLKRQQVSRQHAKALRLMHPDRIRGKRVAVFDDICTTCHQINAIACRLKKEWGATKVYGIVLARTRRQN